MSERERTSVTFTSGALFRRGDYVDFAPSDVIMRVTACTSTTLTVRRVLAWAWAEKVMARWEDWVVWPVMDLCRKIIVRVAP